MTPFIAETAAIKNAFGQNINKIFYGFTNRGQEQEIEPKKARRIMENNEDAYLYNFLYVDDPEKKVNMILFISNDGYFYPTVQSLLNRGLMKFLDTTTGRSIFAAAFFAAAVFAGHSLQTDLFQNRILEERHIERADSKGKIESIEFADHKILRVGESVSYGTGGYHNNNPSVVAAKVVAITRGDSPDIYYVVLSNQLIKKVSTKGGFRDYFLDRSQLSKASRSRRWFLAGALAVALSIPGRGWPNVPGNVRNAGPGSRQRGLRILQASKIIDGKQVKIALDLIARAKFESGSLAGEAKSLMDAINILQGKQSYAVIYKEGMNDIYLMEGKLEQIPETADEQFGIYWVDKEAIIINFPGDKFLLIQITKGKLMGRMLESQEFEILDPAASTDESMTAVRGGIDLNAKRMGLDIAQDGKGVEVKFDAAMTAEFQRGDFTGVKAIIVRITPIESPLPILGLEI